MSEYEVQYWTSMAGIIIGCLVIGFAIGCGVTARKATRLINRTDSSPSETGKRIMAICRRRPNDVLESEVIGD